nr:hypothetical protein CFP56_63328 [Quercus suber]
MESSFNANKITVEKDLAIGSPVQGLTRVWEDDPQWAFRSTTKFQTFPQVLLHVLESDCSGDLFAMLIWNIWF